jgi:hypothetical protein
MPAVKPKKDVDYTDTGLPPQTDDKGKRKLSPSVQKQVKAATGELPNSVGQPKVTGDVEDEAFKKAYERIEQLKKDKSGEQYF